MNKFMVSTASAILVLSLGACAGSGSSSMNAGERITERGGQISQYGDSWSAGNKDVRDGERLNAKSADSIADARKRLDKANAAQSAAQANIAKAEADRARALQMIADGRIKMQRAEADYAAVRSGPAATTNPSPD